MGHGSCAYVRDREAGGGKLSVTATVNGLKSAQFMVKTLTHERDAYFTAKEMYTEATAPEDVLRAIQGWAASASVIGTWKLNGRQALLIHPGLLDSIRMASSSKIVPEVFRTLPYMEPLVVFSDPLHIVSHTRTERTRALGFFTYGKDAQGRQTGTHDPRAVAFGAYILLDVTRDDDESSITECDAILLPMTGDPYTLSEAVDKVCTTFQWSTEHDVARAQKFIRSLMTAVIGSVMYLCSTTVEAEQVPRKAVSKTLGTPKTPFSAYRVGWNIGAALSASRKTISVGDPSQGPQWGEQDPQHRRAHFKTVWTGPGSRTPKTVFVAPYWTHTEKLGIEGVNTARPLRQ